MLDNVLEIETEAVLASMTKARSAAMVFFDFAAAFPSVAHAFIFITLSTLGVPRNIIHAIKQLYKNNIHVLRLGCHSIVGFTVHTGVKQGCPLSGLLFVIVCDSLLRALARMSGPRDVTRAYADDIAMVLRNIWAQAPDIASLFCVLEKIAGLVLKNKKCVIIPLWLYEAESFRNELAKLVPTWANFAVSDSAKYLGIWMGPGARNRTWDEPMEKYMQRCRNLRGLALGLQATAFQYNMFCTTVLSFVGQVSAVPACVLEKEAYCLQMLTAGPWNVFTCSFLARMEECGFAKGFADIAANNIAAMSRTALYLSASYSKCLQQLKQAQDDDETILVPALASWHSKALVLQLEGAVKRTTALKTESVHELLVLSMPFSPADLLRKRLLRWLDACGHPITLSTAVDNASTALKQLAGKVPYCVIAAIWKSWCNGWCTSRRFQEKCKMCILCKDCDGMDELEHYACCPAAHRYLNRRVKLQSRQRSLLSFLLLEKTGGDLLVFLAVLLYAVYGAVNRVRAGQLPYGSFDLDIMLWERSRKVMANSPVYHGQSTPHGSWIRVRPLSFGD